MTAHRWTHDFTAHWGSEFTCDGCGSRALIPLGEEVGHGDLKKPKPGPGGRFLGAGMVGYAIPADCDDAIAQRVLES
jgi:hypothetical protein